MNRVIVPVLPACGCGFPSGRVGPTLTCIPLETRVSPHWTQVAVFSIVRTAAPQEQKRKRNCCVIAVLNSDLILALIISGCFGSDRSDTGSLSRDRIKQLKTPADQNVQNIQHQQRNYEDEHSPGALRDP